MTAAITAMIVDDEPLAREGLLLRLKAVAGIKVVCSCASANEAIIAIQELSPNVVFLDIEMPGMSGLDFANWIQDNMEVPCRIVFVTAFKEFALPAFDFEACDYLLKPFSDERFQNCINKLFTLFDYHEVVQEHKKLDQLLVSKTGKNIEKFMQGLQKSEPGKLSELDKVISLKSGTEWLRVKIDSIFWIEAAGDYMCVHTQEGTHIVRKTLKQFQDELDPKIFTRVNRSALININNLCKLSPNSNGEYVASLRSGDSVKVSRKYKLQLSELNKN